jgi:serine/threonine protein kinase
MSEDEDRAQAQHRQAQHWQAQRRLVAGRYLLLRELGRGGMGVVWLAADEFLGRQVAVKELRPPRGLTGEELDIHQRRALQEARSSARIHHPNAVTLYEAIPASEQDEAVYLIMEFVEGQTLAQLVTRQGPLPSPRVAAFGLQLLDVLEAAHALGIVHRDVKPGNILIAANDQVKLTDFGIAHTMGDPRLTRSGVMGTQAYQAPERFESVSITPAVDMWSLGATLYYAADGRGPFDRNSTGATLRAIVLDDLPAPRCEAHLAAVIAHMLQRDPAERATIDQARAGLHQVPAQESPSSAGPEQPEPKPGWNPDDETRYSSDTLPVDLTPEVPRKRAPIRRYLSRRAVIIAAVVVAVVGGTFGILAAVRGPGTPRSVQLLHPTITHGSTKSRSTPTKKAAASTPIKVAASTPLSEDTAGEMVAFVNSSGQIEDYSYVYGWHGPAVLPGTSRAGSPIVVTPDGSHVFFIERNGDVANDYYISGSGWEGPGPTGGVAKAGSGLSFFEGSGPGTYPMVVFVNASGKLVYDYYASSWHGPAVLPGTSRAGSPVVINSYGNNVFFIEPNGDVAADYYYVPKGKSPEWKGPDRIGGVAEAGSGLAFSPGSKTAGTHPAIVFVNASGKLVYDYYASSWHGPAVLPGSPRAGSPVAWSGDGTSVYFIEPNGEVATDYLSGSRWQGAYRTGGTAARGSALAYAPGNGTAARQPSIIFVASGGMLAYDWYANGWHGSDSF